MAGHKAKTLVGLLSVWWCNCSVQCPFIYQFTEITSIRSKSIYVLLLQVQHSSAHPLSPSRTDVSKQVWLNRNCCMSVAWIPWTLTSKGGEEKCVSKWERFWTYTAYCSTFFFPFSFFFLSICRNMKVNCCVCSNGTESKSNLWWQGHKGQVEAFHNSAESWWAYLYCIYTGRNTKYFTVNDTDAEKKIDSALQRVMCEMILNFLGNLTISRLVKWRQEQQRKNTEFIRAEKNQDTWEEIHAWLNHRF